MEISRRKFVRNMGLGLASMGFNAKALAKNSGGGSEALLVNDRQHPKPAPKGYDRLPLPWYQSRVATLMKKLQKEQVDGILLERDVNKVYFSGCFRGSGERSTWVFFPVKEKNAAYWYSPGIDRDLITSWWCSENEYYFCYPHLLYMCYLFTTSMASLSTSNNITIYTMVFTTMCS